MTSPTSPTSPKIRYGPLWPIVAGSLPCLALAGCAQPLNDRATLGGAQRSPTFRANHRLDSAADPDAHPLLTTVPRPRTDWTPVQYIAPLDGVVHSHELIYYPPLRRDDPPRVFGRYPTVFDALTLQQPGWLENVLDTADELGRSFIGTPYAIGYYIFTGELTEPTLSPRLPWKRTEQSGWSSGYPASPPAYADEDHIDPPMNRQANEPADAPAEEPVKEGDADE